MVIVIFKRNDEKPFNQGKEKRSHDETCGDLPKDQTNKKKTLKFSES